VALLSGGMDSAVLLWKLASMGLVVDALSVHYGQRHAKELDAAREVFSNFATKAGQETARHDVVDLGVLRGLLSASALTGDEAVPHGHYAEESMKVTVVPNRNMIMLAVAAGAAASRGAAYVATAVHAGDHFIYPDCRPMFVAELRRVIRTAMEGLWEVDLEAPFVSISKADICRQGDALGVPFELTWSCYEGGEVHCGKCGTCVERREAFELAGVTDPTSYAG
jgi:7-cyano-7-deazaguanine synthase